jgi:ribosomal protein L11 methyltransferase
MQLYKEIKIDNIDEDQMQILVAMLSGIDYDGFQEEENSLSAFITEDKFDKIQLEEILQNRRLSYSITEHPPQNWNAVWESNFEPVIIDDFAIVRAAFHAPVQNTQHEIVITPKMSFGTGHHATTYMMMQLMCEIDFKNKAVFDFGTGTGVLAILAEKSGADSVLAIDNDEWSIENALENIAVNECRKINVLLSATANHNKKFDIILANINKNVILENIHLLAKQLNTNGILLLSGLLKEDEQDILKAANTLELQHILTQQRGTWIAVQLKIKN